MMKKFTKMVWLIAMMIAANVNVFAVEIAKPLPADCELQNGASYYLYLADQEKFLLAYNLELALADEGSPVNFQQAADGEWSLEGPNGYFYVGIDWVSCDEGSVEYASTWCVEKQSNGAWYFRSSKNGIDFPWETYPDMWTGLSWSSWKIEPVVKVDAGSIAWYLVPVDQLDAFNLKKELYAVITRLDSYGYDVARLVEVYNTANDKESLESAINSVADVTDQLDFENASSEHPYDATARYMVNADLTEPIVNDEVPGWTMWPNAYLGAGTDSAVIGSTYYTDAKILESGWNSSLGDKKLTQKLANLRDGKYRLGNHGMWVNTNGGEVSGAYLYATVGNKTFKTPLTDGGWWTAMTELEFEVTNGEAEVGLLFEATTVGYCRVYDFRLEYLGDMSATDKLNSYISKSQALIEEGGFCNVYVEKLNADIEQANALLASDDETAQQALIETFEKDFEEVAYNKDAYLSLAQLVDEAFQVLLNNDGVESEAIFALSDYMYDNEIEDNMNSYTYDNAQIDELIKVLPDLILAASHSAVAEGQDITDLLVNGHFDTSGGWTPTMGDFSVDTSKKVMEKWWGDWKAEQVLTNLPNGTYRMQVQGFKWCSWDWAQSEADWKAGDQTPTYGVTSMIRLNDDETAIHNVWSCGPTDIQEGYQGDYIVPDNADRALLFFNRGFYENTVETVVTDNTLKVEFDCSNSGFWNIFYNLRLTYLGVDVDKAKDDLYGEVVKAEETLLYVMDGSVRKAIEDAKAECETLISDPEANFDDLIAQKSKMEQLLSDASVSIKDYETLASLLTAAEELVNDESVLATEAGKELQAFYQTTKSDYDSEYPSLNSEGVAKAVEQLEELIAKAKMNFEFKAGDDITKLISNASFENTIGNDQTAADNEAVHNIPYGWRMTVEGTECFNADEMSAAGVNSYTSIEANKYTTDGDYSYCMLSAPQPDSYIYQSIKGLPAGTYRVSVDMAVHYDSECSRLTGQRLLVNNVAQYYGKPEYYIADSLDALHPEEVERTFAGYEEVNSLEAGESADMGNMQTLSVEVTIANGESLTFGVRTDNNKNAMNRSYENNTWDCCGRCKIDNFRLLCVSLDATAITSVEESSSKTGDIYNMMGVKLDRNAVLSKGLYIIDGKKVYIK